MTAACFGSRPPARLISTFPTRQIHDFGYPVPPGATHLWVKLWGAGGQRGGSGSGSDGGAGGYAQALIPVSGGETLRLHVGFRGGTGIDNGSADLGGGFDNAANLGGDGGGLSGLFRGATPLIIAGGGGGGAAPELGTGKDGGAGGGEEGEDGQGPGAGQGGTQDAGGASGLSSAYPNIGGYLRGGSSLSGSRAGMGGGGYYGGGAGGAGGGGIPVEIKGNWNWTGPRNPSGGTTGTASAVWPPTLNTLDNEWLDRQSDGSIIFGATTEGATTSSGTKYTRSELREINAALNNEYEWTPDDTGGRLECTLAVLELPTITVGSDGNNRVVIGQIHGPDDELCRLYFYKSGKLVFYDDKAGSSQTETAFPLEDSGGNPPAIPLGAWFTYVIEADDTGCKVTVWYSGTKYTAFSPLSAFWPNKLCYFKAGVYNAVGGPNRTDATTRGTGRSRAHFKRISAQKHPHTITSTSGDPTFVAGGSGGGGGGGGSSYIGAEGNLYASTLAGSGTVPPKTSDPDYVTGAAVGSGTATSHGMGRCVIRAYTGDPVAAGLVTP